ncbi:hypothetical protein [Mycolicibacterium sphagni]|uniref:GIY-YIG domain-containing protein n=1 Tax=Mycolicibacterium sphagni TaxID=1786 RepID=A0A255DBL4_9MYCO|nr:hypothetical protein [Mycolicibacterium sphagni]OYN76827.1 hypothetical protein CG716_20145 [Mycolicibacterium sphagni]
MSAMARDHTRMNSELANTPSDWFRISRTPGWFVYTMYESAGRIAAPLYVGMTKHPYARLSHHRRLQVWWPLVGDIVIERYDSESDAAEAEERYIHWWKPLFNVTGNVHTPQQENA